jgi:hypothetical protein
MSDDVQHPAQPSIDHAAGWLLSGCASQQRGWTTLDPNEDMVTDAVSIAKSHAVDSGLSTDDADTITADHVLASVQSQAGSGVETEPQDDDPEPVDAPEPPDLTDTPPGNPTNAAQDDDDDDSSVELTQPPAA